MRRVNVAYGLLERMNDLLGNTSSDLTNKTVTQWGVQGVLLENLSRLAKALSGNTNNGRIGWGLTLQPDGTVSEGVGFTSSGEIVYFKGGKNSTVTSGEIYLKYTSMNYGDSDIVDGDSLKGKTSTLSTSTSSSSRPEVDIIYDNTNKPTECIVNIAGSDTIYLGKIEMVSGSPVVTDVPTRGFSPEVDLGDPFIRSEIQANSTVRVGPAGTTTQITESASNLPNITTTHISSDSISNSGNITTDTITVTNTVQVSELSADTYKVGTIAGKTGSFTLSDGTVVTVTNGLITNIQ